MKLSNFQRQSVSLIVLATFVALLHFWAPPVPAATTAGSSEATITQGDSNGPAFIEQEGESQTGIQKEKKFPWLIVGLGAVAVGVVLYFLVIKKPKYTLTVTMSTGCTGTPATTTKYSKGMVVTYNYSASPGYFIQVKLDGVDVPASGTVTMEKDKVLTITAEWDIRGTWLINYHWSSIPFSGYVYQTFSGTGTRGTTSIDGVANGTYKVIGKNVEWTYYGGTKYTGAFSTAQFMSGTMLSYSGLSGTWSAEKTANTTTKNTQTSSSTKKGFNAKGE